jgi:hypothetical protein
MRGMKRFQDTALIKEIIQEISLQESIFVRQKEQEAIGIECDR